jgi:hypothetical protein
LEDEAVNRRMGALIVPLLACLWIHGAAATAQAQATRDFVEALEPEGTSGRLERLARVEARRNGPVVIVHRGASALAPENTLLGCARAMDCGADGVEVDLRQTADGILVLFHDEVVDRLMHGIGTVRQHTARELLALKPRGAFGRPVGGTPASFAQLLGLARQRAMLLHLDLKEAGLEADAAQWLDAADCWDHVVSVNSEHATQLVTNPRLRLLRYKVPGMYAQRQDLDPAAVEAALRQPGQMILVDDPRVAARVLGRDAYTPVMLAQMFRYSRAAPPGPREAGAGGFDPLTHLAALTLRVNPDSAPSLLALLEAPSASPEPARLVERGWAADRLGQLGGKRGDVVRALERVVATATPYSDWHYDRLDGALAARALGQLGAVGSAPVVLEALRRLDQAAETASVPTEMWEARMAATARFRLHLLTALGDLRCRAVRRFLEAYLEPEAQVSARGERSFMEEATRALLRQNLAWDDIARLLRSPSSTVRGTVLLECVDWPNEERRKALATAAGWALGLPRVPYGVVSPRPAPVPTRPGVAVPLKHPPTWPASGDGTPRR